MEDTKTAEKLLTATVGGKKYAIPVSEVVCVLPLHRDAIAPVPYDTSGRIRGIVNCRGSVVAILRRADLAAQSDERGAEELTAVVLTHGERRFALLVDRAETITRAAVGAQRVTARELYLGETLHDD